MVCIHMPHRRTIIILVVSVLAGAAGSDPVAAGDGARGVPAGPDASGVPLRSPLPQGASSLYDHPWVWRDDSGADLSLARFRGAPVIITMGYASCQVRCPPTLSKLQHLEHRFAALGRRATFILVTVDPATDTPARLAALRQKRGLTSGVWHLLAGPEAQTRELARFLDISYVDAGGHFEHQVRVIVLDAEGRIARRFEGWHFDESQAL
jgi:protein SCO1/2